ncbi:site-specific DNA-methyltransferase [Anaerococcus sp. ENR1011]|uniref:Site-specific DNA-methyltransferase n=1 Tax=Anaerococcus groningensis TaxID=3115616 RepID=A0ABW9N0W0_9FIRM
MDKLDMHTKNLADKKYQALKDLFPNAITETKDENGELVRAIDKDILMQEVSTHVVEGKDERYQFTWPDKKKAILNANAPINKTLRPAREESVNFDETENLYIEGDNLEVLKLLQETYLGKIRMIYIDPPYNTGKDFVYNDDFKESVDEYLENGDQYDEEGNRLEANRETDGRYHTNWLNMMYPRLKLARDLLSDDGVIFISIDDNEKDNLKKICDDIFGESNFLAEFIWNNKYTVSNDTYISNQHETIFLYSKSGDFNINLLPRSEKQNKDYRNRDNDPKGPWKPTPIHARSGSLSGKYEITFGNGVTWTAPDGRYPRYSRKKLKQLYENNELYFNKNGGVDKKTYLSEVRQGMTIGTLWRYEDVGHSHGNNEELSSLLGKGIFNDPKGTKLIKRILQIASEKDSIILDFFSGSATTAHATMQLNAKDGGNRKFIMVQLPEATNKKSVAYKAGYKTIAEIGKERIRRAGKKILDENKDKEGIENLDIGFRVLKTDSSNMKDVYYSPADTEQSFLDDLADNIKEDRTSEDLLFQAMLDLGISLSSKIESQIIDGKEVFAVEDGFLIACFDKDVTEDTVKEIAKKEPYYAVFRDKSMASDSVAANFDQIFASISPETIRRVI